MSDWRTEDVTDWQARAEAAEAERDALRATVERVTILRDRWRHDQMVTLGKTLPGGVLSISMQSAEWMLTRALDGGDE